MRFLPKLVLAIALITILGVLILYPKNKESKATVSIVGNQFSLSFDIAKKDQGEFSNILAKASLPIKDGIKFQLDATSSAALAFASPVNASLKINQNKLVFSGSLNHPKVNQYQPKPVKVPKEANLLIFSSSFNYFASDYLNILPQLVNFLENLQKPNTGQVLALWADKPNWFFSFDLRDGQNLDDLKKLNNELNLNDPYKNEELPNGTQLHLVKTKSQDQETTLAIFQKDEQVFVSGSKEVAEEIIKLQNSSENLRTFPSQDSPVFALVFKNPQNNPVSQNLYNLIFHDQSTYLKTAQHIADIEFLLKQDSFSGLINLK